MAQQYKFYRNADNVGIMEKFPTGENVIVFGSSDYFVLTTPTGVSLKPITIGNPTYTILFADVINDLNVAAASIDEASEIVGGVLGVVSSGGGGGGDATAANQTAQIAQQTSAINTSQIAWSSSAAPLTTADWLARLNVKQTGFVWGVDTVTNTYVLITNNRNGSGVDEILFKTPDGGGYIPLNPLTVVPVESAQTVRTLTSTLAIASGSTASSTISVSFITSNAFVGTINGVARGINQSIFIESDARGLLPAIPYTITSGSLLIDIIV